MTVKVHPSAKIVPRTWRVQDLVSTLCFMVTLSVGYIALFPYDRLILGPLTGVAGFIGLQLIVGVSVFYLLMRSNGGWKSTLLSGALLAVLFLTIAWIRVFRTPGIDPLADRDEALQIAIDGLISGVGPYLNPTQVGNPISPLFGGIVLFTPQYFLGTTEIFDVITILVFAIFLLRVIGIRPSFAFFILLFSAASFRWEVLIQSDGWVNAVYVLLAVLWSTSAIQKPLNSLKWKVNVCASSLFLALAMAYRFHFLIVLIPLTIWALRSLDLKRGVLWIFSTCTTTLLIALVPFVIWPSPFGPQHLSTHLLIWPDTWVEFFVIISILVLLATWLTKVKTVHGVLLWSAATLTVAIVALGFLQVDWPMVSSASLQGLLAYPPDILRSFGSYHLTANNGGVLIWALFAMLMPLNHLSNGRQNRRHRLVIEPPLHP